MNKGLEEQCGESVVDFAHCCCELHCSWSERNDYQKQLKSETQRLIAAHCVVQLVCDEDAILG